MIAEETVERVLQNTDIVDLIQSYFPLRKAGLDFTALCPFHNEKTPSFTVSPSKQMFYCFGCGAGGGPARFLMEREGIDFPSAIRRLAERSGIPIIEDQVSPETSGKLKRRSQLLAVHQAAAQWFHINLLQRKDADHARRYLKGRGLGIDVARDWQLGYAPADSRKFFEWARNEGYDNELLIETGMIAEREGPSGRPRLVGRFRDRLMFPVCNDFGEVIAFSGRLLDPDANMAKYLNSPETALFHKSKTLFGLHRSKRPILKAGRAVVCEGQIDLITAFSEGIETLVAPLGTAFTAEHARLLKRLTSEVVVCYDADAAGFKAAQRTFKALAEANVFVRAVEMPDGEDPDSYIRKNGAERFQALLEEASDFLEFHIAHRSKAVDLHAPKEQHALAGELADNIALVRDKMMQETMINAVASRLGLSQDAFRRRVFGALRSHEKQKERQARWEDGQEEPLKARESYEFQDRASRLLCQMMLIDPAAKSWALEELKAYETLQYIPDGELLIRVAEGGYSPEDNASVVRFLSALGDPLESTLAKLTMKPPDGNHLLAAKDAWSDLTAALVKRRYHEVTALLKKSDLAPDKMMDLLGELKALKEKLDR